MKDYWVYYNCPHCPSPCTTDDPCEEASEGIVADSKTEARRIFNRCKQCRWMKITRIEEDQPITTTITWTNKPEWLN